MRPAGGRAIARPSRGTVGAVRRDGPRPAEPLFDDIIVELATTFAQYARATP